MAELWSEYDDLTDGWNEQAWVDQTWTAAGDLTDGWADMDAAYDEGILGDDSDYIIGDDDEYIIED